MKLFFIAFTSCYLQPSKKCVYFLQMIVLFIVLLALCLNLFILVGVSGFVHTVNARKVDLTPYLNVFYQHVHWNVMNAYQDHLEAAMRQQKNVHPILSVVQSEWFQIWVKWYFIVLLLFFEVTEFTMVPLWFQVVQNLNLWGELVLRLISASVAQSTLDLPKL